MACQADEGAFPSISRRRRWAGLTAAFFACTQSRLTRTQHQLSRELHAHSAQPPHKVLKTEYEPPRTRPIPTPPDHLVFVEISSLSTIAPSVQQEARAHQVGEQTLFEAGLFDTAPIYSETTNGSGTGSGSGSDIKQENEITLSFSKDRFDRLKEEYAKTKEVQRDRIIFDGYELNIEYAKSLISKIDDEFEKADPSSPSVIFYGTGISPRVVGECEMVKEDPETTDEEAVELEATECEQLPESAAGDAPVLAYMSFE